MGTSLPAPPALEVKIFQRLSNFREDLIKHSVEIVVQKHITFGDTYLLSQDQYFHLKAQVAKQFKLHPSEVVMVGSRKLGFSIAPMKKYKPFSQSSDIDITLISSKLFDEYWLATHEFLKTGQYWQKQDDFKRYLFNGWIRPDKLPASPKFSLTNEWWDFFRALERTRQYGNFNIRAGLYRSWYFLESYQLEAVRGCQEEL